MDLITYRKKRWLSLLIIMVMSVSLLSTSVSVSYAGQTGNLQPEDLLVGDFPEVENEVESDGSCSDGADYDGYIFKLKDSVSESRASSFEKKEIRTDDVEKLDYVDKTYTAEDLGAIDDFVPLELVEYIEPDYTVEMIDGASDEAAGEVSVSGPMATFEPMSALNPMSAVEPMATLNPMSALNPNDALYNNQWNLKMVSAPALWEYGIEGQAVESDDREVVVAVIDSGIKLGHEDFNWDLIKKGKNFVGENPSATDPADNSAADSQVNDTVGHGTFVTGVIAAEKDNDVGIAGITPRVSVLPLRVFESTTTSISVIVDAMNYAIDQDVDVINLSLGSEASSEVLEEACEVAVGQGILVVAAAGNDGDYRNSYPAQYDCVVGVGSVNSDKNCSGFSQRGANKVFVTAPGRSITSTYNYGRNSYTQGSGTSYSAPKVAALAAAVKSVDATVTMGGFKELLIDTSKDLGIPGVDDLYGHGLIDFEAVCESLVGADVATKTSQVKFDISNTKTHAVNGAVVQLEKVEVGGNKSIIVDDIENCTLTYGAYNCKVEAAGHEPTEAAFCVYTQARTVKVVLDTETYGATFSVSNTSGVDITSDASVVVESEEGVAVSRIADGVDKGKFAVKSGKYNYTVTANNYYSTSGTFTVTDGPVDVAVTLLDDNDLANVSFKVTDSVGKNLSNAVVRVSQDDKEIFAHSDGKYKLIPGSYKYEVSATKYKGITDFKNIEDTDKGTAIVIEVQLVSTGGGSSNPGGDNGNPGSGDPDGDPSTDPNADPDGDPNADPDEELRTPTNGGLTAEQIDKIMSRFTDVKKGGWYYNNAAFVIYKEYFKGTSNTTFSPNLDTTRAMIVTILARMSGEDLSGYTSTFSDVKSTDWFAKEVAWAAEKGIARGVADNKFAPNKKITRQELISMVYEYAKYKKYDVTVNNPTKINAMKDVGSIAPWAIDAFVWGISEGLLSGYNDKTLRPQNNATRAEVATIIATFKLTLLSMPPALALQ